MAHIHQEVITIKVSKLVKDDHDECVSEIPAEVVVGLEAVVAELLGDPALVVEVSVKPE